jgi:hypothetical protein
MVLTTRENPIVFGPAFWSSHRVFTAEVQSSAQGHGDGQCFKAPCCWRWGGGVTWWGTPFHWWFMRQPLRTGNVLKWMRTGGVPIKQVPIQSVSHWRTHIPHSSVWRDHLQKKSVGCAFNMAPSKIFFKPLRLVIPKWSTNNAQIIPK